MATEPTTIKHYLGDELLPVCGGQGGGKDGMTSMTPRLSDVTCPDCLAVVPPLTEENALPIPIRVEDVRKGMRIKFKLRDPNYRTVSLTRSNKGQRKMTIVLEHPDPENTDGQWYYPEFNTVAYLFDPEKSQRAPSSNVLVPECADKVEYIEEVMLPTAVAQLSGDLERMAEFYDRKAEELRGCAVAVRIDGKSVGVAAFEGLARKYADVIAHNSSGTTSSVAMQIATVAGYVTLLDVLKPERHQQKDEEG